MGNGDTATDQARGGLEQALADKKISATAVENVRVWLREDRYATYQEQILDHIQAGKWQELDDAFWTVIPFGTGGRRGRMYPIGSNAINDQTIGESAQGLASYVRAAQPDGPWACAIAYDTRHNSRHFAELCSEVMVAAGFQVFFLDGYRSTPELSFLVRHKKCQCGIMVTASHNPPSDNAVKVYWETGGQILPPHDKGIIDCVMSAEVIERADFSSSLAEGKVVYCNDETDEIYVNKAAAESLSSKRDIRILYSPLHGVGASAVCPVLAKAGFENVEVFGPHEEPDGDFPNVPGHVSNPENPEVFSAMIDQAKTSGAELILASDPDCDRMGCAAPLTLDTSGPWATLNGNQLGSLLAEHILEQRRNRGDLRDDQYMIKTLVTTEMIRRIGESYGIETHGDLLVGFKWIAGLIDECGPDQFLYGTEESHGFLVGQYCRDKDGAVASLLMAEFAAELKAQGMSLHEKMDALYWQHGYHAERLMTVMMPGAEGMSRMQDLMNRFRSEPPLQLGEFSVAVARDYLSGETISPDGSREPFLGPTDNLIFLDFEQSGNYVAVRPSGTEPKVKFYMFAYTAAEQLADLQRTKESTAAQLDQLEQSLRSFALG